MIRKLTHEDYNMLYKLWDNTPGMGLNPIDDSYEGIKKYLDRNPETSFGAFENDILAGAILCGHDGRRGFIHHTAVSLEYRNKGIGKALLDAAINALEKEGISKAMLVVFKDNEIGNIFWEKQGFTVRNDLNYRNKSIKNI